MSGLVCSFCKREAQSIRFVMPETGKGPANAWCQKCPLPEEAARANDEMLTELFSGTERGLMCYDYPPTNYPPA